jgi:uncharacterized protein YgiM (DUF1202 family)
MRSLLVGLLLTLIVALGSAPASAQELATIQDPDGYTNLREGPGTDYPVLAQIKVGQYFAVFPETSEWWRVVVPTAWFVKKAAVGGRGVRPLGFIHSSRVRSLGGRVVELAIVVDPDGYTNVRGGRSTQARILGRVDDGEVVMTLERVNQDRWIQVATRGGTRGYMHASRLRPIQIHP